MAQTEKLLWSLPQVARILGMDVKTVRSGVHLGEIPTVTIAGCVKVPLWWIKQQRDGAAQAA